MKRNNFKILDDNKDEKINFRLVGFENNDEKTYENVEFEVIDEKDNDKSSEEIYIDVKDAFSQHSNKTKSNNNIHKQDYSIFNMIITFILEILFCLIAFSIPILGFVLSIVYFIKDDKLSALTYIILAILGYIANVNLILDIINSVF